MEKNGGKTRRFEFTCGCNYKDDQGSGKFATTFVTDGLNQMLISRVTQNVSLVVLVVIIS